MHEENGEEKINLYVDEDIEVSPLEWKMPRLLFMRLMMVGQLLQNIFLHMMMKMEKVIRLCCHMR
jgi:hypothetical protein